MYDECVYVDFKCQRPFGVELEIDNNIPQAEVVRLIQLYSHHKSVIMKPTWGVTEDNDYWHVKTDATCGSNGESGWEVASYKASGRDDVEHIAFIAGQLRRSGAAVNDHCALHVHVDIGDFLGYDVGILLAYCLKCEMLIASMVPIYRLGSEHCKLYRLDPDRDFDKPFKPLSLWAALKPGDLSTYNNMARRVSLNLVNYAQARSHQSKRCTVELRLPENSLEPRDVTNWIWFFLRFVEQTRKRRMPANLKTFKLHDFMRFMGLHHRRKFCIFSEELFHLRSWILLRIMTHGLYELPKQAEVLWRNLWDSSGTGR